MNIIKILLVDDDADDREFFRQAVEEAGVAAVLTALEDGQKLLEMLSRTEDPIVPDVIFLDLNMPGVDGKVCLGEIRRLDIFSETPVIILSTSNRLKDIDETYLGGANLYIPKIVFYTRSAEWVGRLFPHADWRKALMNPTREKFAVTV